MTLSKGYSGASFDVHTLVTQFTYFNTLLVGEEPLVLSSTATVANVATVARPVEVIKTSIFRSKEVLYVILARWNAAAGGNRN